MDMMDSGFDFSIIWSIFGVLLSLAVLGICVYYLIAKPGSASILLTIGSFIQLLVSLFYSIGIRIFDSIGSGSMMSVYTVVGAIGFLGGLCHASGLIVLIINHINLSKRIKAYE